MTITHLLGPGAGADYTACGLAVDAFESGDEDSPVLMARAGEATTCADCRSVVDYYKAISRYRQP